MSTRNLTGNRSHDDFGEIDGKSGPLIVSRRTLLGGATATALAMGGMMLLPKVPGGYLAPVFDAFGPRTAYADTGTSSFTFTVVGADQVGFHVVDVSTQDSSGNYKPVKDATVTLTSRFNKQTVSGDTDDKGRVTLSIGTLAFTDPTAGFQDGVYRCNASISVTTRNARAKMRDFSAGLVTLEGATGIVVGTHKVDSNDVYLERCTLDDWDVHYSKNTFLRSSKNTADHTVFVRIAGVAQDTKVTMTILNAKKDKTLVAAMEATATYDAASKLAVGSFTGRFLQTGHAQCITEDEAVLRIAYTAGSATKTDDIEVSVEDTPIDEAVMGANIIPFTTDAESLFNFQASGDWPCFNGLSFSVLSPAFPLQISTSLLATSIGIGTDIRLKGDDGKPSATDWMKDHKGNVLQRYKNLRKRQYDEYEARTKSESEVEMDDLSNPNPKSVAQKNKFLGNFDFNVIARIILSIQYAGFEGQGENYKTKWQGGVTGELGFHAEGTLTFEFMAGPVPMYASVALGLTALAAYTATITKEQLRSVRELDCNNLVYNFDNSVGLLLKINLTLSIGVGYKGLCSLSFDATFEFPFYFGWKQKGGKGKADPHITIGVSILLEIVFQCLLFKLSGQIYSYEKKDWFNNWSSGDTPALTGDDAWAGIEPRFRLTQPDGTLRHTHVYSNDGVLLVGNAADPLADAVPVTNSQMMGSREADARLKAADGAGAIDEAAEAARFVAVADEEGVFRRDDGTVVYVNKMPRPVVRENGSVGTELVDCEGANTFYFGEDDEAALEQEENGGLAPTRAAGAVAGTAAAAPKGAAAGAAMRLAAVSLADRFEGDAMLGFALGAGEEYSYTPVAGKNTGAYCGASGIKGIAPHGGVTPSVDAVIFKDVHSDPRQRVVSIGGVPYLFRVITVSYPTAKSSYCRSRLVASAFDLGTYKWGDPKVIEYNTGNKDLPRVNIYDYEFDIVVRSGGGKWTQDAEACLVVTGGLRPDGDNTSIYDVFSTSTVAVVLIDKDLNVVQRSVRSVSAIVPDGNAHMLCSPCIVDGFAADGASGALAYAFLHRSASSKTALATAAASVTFNVGYCYVRDGYLSFPSDLKTGPALSASVFGIKACAGSAASGKYDALLTVLIGHDAGFDVCSVTVPPNKTFADAKVTHCIASKEALPEMQPWPTHGTFLFVKERPATENDAEKDFHLYEGSYDPTATGQAGFTAKQVDTAGFKGASFCVSPTGEFIFYYESFRDKPDDDPKADWTSSNVSGSGDDSVHRIVASRLLNGTFCEDFPFCEVDHPIDHIEIVNIAPDVSSFVATHITNADKSLADIRYIAVPNTLAAEVKSFVQTDAFVYAGKKNPFQLDVRNHGNLIIGGFDVQMLDPSRGNLVVSTVHVGELKPDKMVITAQHLGWGESSASDADLVPTLTDEEKKGMLMPGKLVSYQVEFDIPSDWTGEKRVILRIVNAWTPGVRAEAQDGAMGTQADEDDANLATFFHKGADGAVKLHDAEAEGLLYDPAETVEQQEKDSENPRRRAASSTVAPSAGDSLDIVGPLAVALGGLGALAAGYSARRMRNERQQQEGEEA